MRTKACLECLAAVRARVDVPIVTMTYSSLLEAYGWERFAADAQAAGATSLIIVDLPAEEKPELRRVQLVAPTSTDERLRLAAEQTDGWLYLVSVTGTTGARSGLSNALAHLAGERGAVTGRAALRGLRDLDSRRRAGGGRADRRRRRRLARARGRRRWPQSAARLRSLACETRSIPPEYPADAAGTRAPETRDAPVWVMRATRFRGFQLRQNSSTFRCQRCAAMYNATRVKGNIMRKRTCSVEARPHRALCRRTDRRRRRTERRPRSGLDVRQGQSRRRLDVEGHAQRRLDVAGQAERRLVELNS